MERAIDPNARDSSVAIIVVVMVVVISFLAFLDDPEQPVRFTVRTGREVEVGRNPGSACTSECKTSQTVNRHRALFRAFEQATESAVFVERHDCAAAKIANQHLVELARVDARQFHVGRVPGAEREVACEADDTRAVAWTKRVVHRDRSATKVVSLT